MLFLLILCFAAAALAVSGLPHAFNLIDGYNGLAGASAGFLLLNYPRGLIFAGDGGAYLWGVVIAILSILLVKRHPQVFHDDAARQMLMRNNRTSPYLWGFAVLTVVPAVLFWNRTPLLMLFILFFIVSYVWAYTSIIHFKVPRWLRR